MINASRLLLKRLPRARSRLQALPAQGELNSGNARLIFSTVI